MTRKARKSAPKGSAAPATGSTPAPTTFAEAYKNLNPQRRKFVAAYLERPNATRAAKNAGYSEATARSQGQRLLTFDDVRTALRLGWAEAGASAEEVRARTEEVMRGSVEDFYAFDLEQVRPPALRPVRELLAELREEIEFEEEYARRAVMSEEAETEHRAAQLRRMDRALRMEIKLERDPNATAWAPGPPELRSVARLDLAKARDLGVLHLLKTVKPTKWGTVIELQDAQHARDQIGKIHGLWGADDDGPDTPEGLPEGTGLEDATPEQLQGELMRLLGEDAL